MRTRSTALRAALVVAVVFAAATPVAEAQNSFFSREIAGLGFTWTGTTPSEVCQDSDVFGEISVIAVGNPTIVTITKNEPFDLILSKPLPDGSDSTNFFFFENKSTYTVVLDDLDLDGESILGDWIPRDFNQGSVTALLRFTVVPSCSQPPLQVEIDLKPGSNPSSVNLGSRGTTPLAVFGSESFDPTLIDASTLEINGQPAAVAVKHNGGAHITFSDLNDDGFLDAVLHLETQGLALVDGGPLTLAGALGDSTPFEGAQPADDPVKVVP